MKKYTNTVTPEGKFIFGIHKPSYSVTNLRENARIRSLGKLQDQKDLLNYANYPQGDIDVDQAKWIYEIPNPFPFRGATFIDKEWADASAEAPQKIALPQQEKLSFTDFLRDNSIDAHIFANLPPQLLLTLATCSSDPKDLIKLAEMSCRFSKNDSGDITGLCYLSHPDGRIEPEILHHDLFEAVANNSYLPEPYKQAMVLRPGAQGRSEIVGEWQDAENSHVFEYLRRNSYISGGHFAANMADDTSRYSIEDLSPSDMKGLRHLYYQRIFVRIADILGISIPYEKTLKENELEDLRQDILDLLDRRGGPNLCTLWGWNFGFDFSPTLYRLHASHQQIHQQYALIPEEVQAYYSGHQQAKDTLRAYSSGDKIGEVIDDYSRHTGSDFFTDYFSAIRNNQRMDEREDLDSSLIVWEDQHALLFVPKAQTSQWELQISTKKDSQYRFPGNILETSTEVRESLDHALLHAQQTFAQLGAKMVTSIEYSKRIAKRQSFCQPLIYSLLPKLPFSMGAFSEAHMRYINGHYPEDFAAVCRKTMEDG